MVRGAGRFKKALAAVLCLVLIGLLVGCSNGKLPDGMEEDDLIARAKAAGDALVARDYEAFLEMFPKDGRGDLTVEVLASYYDPVLDALGTGGRYSNVAVGPYTDADGTQYGVVLVEQMFAKGSMNHTATFAEGPQLIGFIRTDRDA
ncbi:MAG: hypothetical protein AB7V55_05905 [Oscillospiraceae bacterium]